MKPELYTFGGLFCSCLLYWTFDPTNVAMIVLIPFYYLMFRFALDVEMGRKSRNELRRNNIYVFRQKDPSHAKTHSMR